MIRPRFYVPTFFSCDFNEIVHSDRNVYTLKNNGKLTDLTGGLTSHSIIGWNDLDINKSITNQITKYTHLDYKNFFDPLRESLAEILIKSLPIESCSNMYKVFFSGLSGSDAIESAIKLSYQYFRSKGELRKTRIISFSESYHGSTLGALALGDRPNLEIYRDLTPHNVIRIPEVNQFRLPNCLTSELELLEYSLKNLETQILLAGPDTILAIVGETISGGLTGFVPKPLNYWQRVQDLCRRFDILLILDEIICGTGTTGTYFSWEQDKIYPDITVLGKTLSGGYLPLNAVVAREHIFDAIEEKDGRIQQSNTFQGHSLAVAAAIVAQERISSPKFLQSILDSGLKLRSHIHSELGGSRFYKGVAGRGLRFSIQLHGSDSNAFARYVTKICQEKRGLIVDGKWHRFTFSPQLDLDFNSLFDSICVFLEVYKDCETNLARLHEFRFSDDVQRRY